MKIISLNTNTWNHTLTKRPLNVRLSNILNSIDEENPDIVCLQEMKYGRNGKYVEQIKNELPGYQIILPIDFDVDEHSYSIISIMLVKEGIDIDVKSVSDIELTNRYNLVEIGDGLRILNIHIPQTSEFSGAAKWYVQERLRLAAQFWETVEKVSTTYQGKMIVVGDMNQNAHGAQLTSLQADGFTRLGYYDPEFIDHILLSPSADIYFKHKKLRVDDTISTVDMYTDHPMLIANIA
ncbi:MAG: hypothetical protein MR945_04510 [Agathobacter sp.]|nr:hypothetical protein [Agathobacter sp.]